MIMSEEQVYLYIDKYIDFYTLEELKKCFKTVTKNGMEESIIMNEFITYIENLIKYYITIYNQNKEYDSSLRYSFNIPQYVKILEKTAKIIKKELNYYNFKKELDLYN